LHNSHFKVQIKSKDKHLFELGASILQTILR
jgi:hypothetical protein